MLSLHEIHAHQRCIWVKEHKYLILYAALLIITLVGLVVSIYFTVIMEKYNWSEWVTEGNQSYRNVYYDSRFSVAMFGGVLGSAITSFVLIVHVPTLFSKSKKTSPYNSPSAL